MHSLAKLFSALDVQGSKISPQHIDALLCQARQVVAQIKPSILKGLQASYSDASCTSTYALSRSSAAFRRSCYSKRPQALPPKLSPKAMPCM